MENLKELEAILDKIEKEQNENVILKAQLKKQDNRLIAIRLAKDKKIDLNVVFNVKVKIFYSIFHLHNLYQHEIPLRVFESLQTKHDVIFYLIELYVAKPLQEVITSLNLLIHTNIRNSTHHVNQSTVTSNNQCSNPFLIVCSFENTTEDSIVSLTLHSRDEKPWITIHVPNKFVDISYHFRPHEPTKSLVGHEYNSLLNKNIEYVFQCKCSKKHFFQTIIRHSYHQFDAELFHSFADNEKKETEVTFNIGTNCTISLNLSNDSLRINAPWKEMQKLKKLFIDNILCEDIEIDKTSFMESKNLLYCVKNQMCEEPDEETIRSIYLELKSIIHEFSV